MLKEGRLWKQKICDSSEVLSEQFLRKKAIVGIARQVATGLGWDYRKGENKSAKASMDMAAACNNCSLKEKEQVYTAARDGNNIYLKVSLDEKDCHLDLAIAWNQPFPMNFSPNLE